MLRLRVLTCMGLMLGIVFFCCQPLPMYGPAGWHVAFLLINFYQIWHLLRERERLSLNKGQAKIAAQLEKLTDEELIDSLSHLLSTDVEQIELIRKGKPVELTPEEKALRDIAVSRLSRDEIINLIVRRIWRSMKNPSTKSMAT